MDDMKAILEIEAANGAVAKTQLEILSPFFKEKELVLFEAFKDSSITSKDSLVDIKMQLNVLSGMKQFFQCKIDTGLMAQQTLNEGDEHG